MATVTTSITPAVRTFPFAGYREPEAEDTGAARGQLFAFATNTEVAASGVGDNQRILVSLAFPGNFAYVMCDLSMNVRAATGGTYGFPLNGELDIIDATGGGQIQMGLNAAAVSIGSATVATSEGATYKPFNPWCGLFANEATGTATMRGALFNTTANDTAYNVDFMARFLVYGFEQMHHLAVNSSIPVRS